MEKINKTEEQWKKELSKEEYAVLREGGTEIAFSGKSLGDSSDGMYSCMACGNKLFLIDRKFESSSGWPSFDKAISGAIRYIQDNSVDMKRTEVVCAKCNSHLGHVFDDGPTDTRKRYCINSICLKSQK